MTQHDLVQKLVHDPEVDWSSLKTYERQKQKDSHLPKHWKSKLINKLSSPGRFEHGGHRSTVKEVPKNDIVSYGCMQLEHPLIIRMMTGSHQTIKMSVGKVA